MKFQKHPEQQREWLWLTYCSFKKMNKLQPCSQAAKKNQQNSRAHEHHHGAQLFPLLTVVPTLGIIGKGAGPIGLNALGKHLTDPNPVIRKASRWLVRLNLFSRTVASACSAMTDNSE